MTQRVLRDNEWFLEKILDQFFITCNMSPALKVKCVHFFILCKLSWNRMKYLETYVSQSFIYCLSPESGKI